MGAFFGELMTRRAVRVSIAVLCGLALARLPVVQARSIAAPYFEIRCDLRNIDEIKPPARFDGRYGMIVDWRPGLDVEEVIGVIDHCSQDVDEVRGVFREEVEKWVVHPTPAPFSVEQFTEDRASELEEQRTSSKFRYYYEFKRVGNWLIVGPYRLKEP